ncbi:hypothetical protein H6F73_06230 [Microcoleus sp. FACHB-68]|nr:hypothetical protein [Microcoleus sp. FACHB-68]
MKQPYFLQGGNTTRTVITGIPAVVIAAGLMLLIYTHAGFPTMLYSVVSDKICAQSTTRNPSSFNLFQSLPSPSQHTPSPAQNSHSALRT